MIGNVPINLRLASILGEVIILCSCGAARADSIIQLEWVTSTRIEIVLRWEDSSEALPLYYELERSTSEAFTDSVKIELESEPNIYADTGSTSERFRLRNTSLDIGRVYYYRIRGHYGRYYSEYSNTIRACLSYPVRGIAGDLFADVVLGQPDFAQNCHGATVPLSLHIGGGILIDRTSNPQRLYLVDSNHNRILGFRDVTARPLIPDIVIGQPDFYSSPPNGDATVQCFPEYARPTASTLALVRPDQVSVAEAVLWNQMAVDASGALYVADRCNNRVLKYEDLFATDTVADRVWGQPDFFTRGANTGGRSNQSLHLDATVGVAIDPGGSLWVADSFNYRVLRFPYEPTSGEISKEADLVLGQHDFQTATHEWVPTSIQVAQDGTVYVAVMEYPWTDPANLFVYEPPFYNGMPPSRSLASYPTIRHPDYVVLDPLGRGIWVQSMGRSWNSTTTLLDLDDGHVIYNFASDEARGLGIDKDGSLYIHIFMDRETDGIYYYPLPYNGAGERIFKDGVVRSGRDFWRLTGATTFGNQLIVSDASRLLIWNGFKSLESYAHADDIWGQEDFEAYDASVIRMIGFPHVDAAGELWVFGRFRKNQRLVPGFKAFSYPLTHDSTPVRELWDTYDLVDRSGTVTLCDMQEPLEFEITDNGDQMWIADWLNSRVLRVNNIRGGNDPGRGPYVDVILGQPDATSTGRNQGAGFGNPAPETMDLPRFVSTDDAGRLYVSDSSSEGGTNRRLLIFEGSLFPDRLDEVLYEVRPTAVLGTGGDYDVMGCKDETCDPKQVSFGASGSMIVGMGAYNPNNQRFPLLYRDPARYGRAHAALGDFCGMPTHTHVDGEGNIYVADYCWARLLIYWRPFERLIGQVGNCSVRPEVHPYANGDFDGNGVVNLDDFTALAGHWHMSDLSLDIAPPGGDCTVNFRDLAVLVDHWLED